ncbi:hypothetical protein V6Z11_D12G118100 [Gossypium hirsutum]|uniref:Uncharacterized protein isoform X1 n=1 Tax=Gossypium hirsutum TaxID=3635 RepID=A0A1U8N851_GOSHI|nr:uncharacterized protein LOC107945606 isoform X1 [Gossypium hirsutum]
MHLEDQRRRNLLLEPKYTMVQLGYHPVFQGKNGTSCCEKIRHTFHCRRGYFCIWEAWDNVWIYADWSSHGELSSNRSRLFSKQQAWL